MNITAAAEHMELLVSLAILVCLFYGPWQQFVVDVLRQNLFRMRDEIFMCAADGKIGFDSPEYQAIRGRLNAMIRYAHTATWAHIFAVILVAPKHQKPAFNITSIAARIPDPNVAGMVLSNYNKAVMLVTATLMVRSLILLTCSVVAVPILIVLALIDQKSMERSIAPIGDAIERDVDSEQERRLAAA